MNERVKWNCGIQQPNGRASDYLRNTVTTGSVPTMYRALDDDSFPSLSCSVN